MAATMMSKPFSSPKKQKQQHKKQHSGSSGGNTLWRKQSRDDSPSPSPHLSFLYPTASRSQQDLTDTATANRMVELMMTSPQYRDVQRQRERGIGESTSTLSSRPYTEDRTSLEWLRPSPAPVEDMKRENSQSSRGRSTDRKNSVDLEFWLERPTPAPTPEPRLHAEEDGEYLASRFPELGLHRSVSPVESLRPSPLSIPSAREGGREAARPVSIEFRNSPESLTPESVPKPWMRTPPTPSSPARQPSSDNVHPQIAHPPDAVPKPWMQRERPASFASYRTAAYSYHSRQNSKIASSRGFRTSTCPEFSSQQPESNSPAQKAVPGEWLEQDEIHTLRLTNDSRDRLVGVGNDSGNATGNNVVGPWSKDEEKEQKDNGTDPSTAYAKRRPRKTRWASLPISLIKFGKRKSGDASTVVPTESAPPPREDKSNRASVLGFNFKRRDKRESQRKEKEMQIDLTAENLRQLEDEASDIGGGRSGQQQQMMHAGWDTPGRNDYQQRQIQEGLYPQGRSDHPHAHSPEQMHPQGRNNPHPQYQLPSQQDASYNHPRNHNNNNYYYHLNRTLPTPTHSSWPAFLPQRPLSSSSSPPQQQQQNQPHTHEPTPPPSPHPYHHPALRLQNTTPQSYRHPHSTTHHRSASQLSIATPAEDDDDVPLCVMKELSAGASAGAGRGDRWSVVVCRGCGERVVSGEIADGRRVVCGECVGEEERVGWI